MDEAVEAFAREYYGNAPVARDPQIIGAIKNALSAADANRLALLEETVTALKRELEAQRDAHGSGAAGRVAGGSGAPP